MNHPLSSMGFLRIKQIIGNPRAKPPIPPIIPVSRSTWWCGVKNGTYPQPTRSLGKRVTAWRIEDIQALVEKAGRGAR